ncbi:hypothetical protein I3760_01G123800 [Carya illinoinensis]|nr:hypothetical protein I3760_01G123800 [Carya illinoinensis]
MGRKSSSSFSICNIFKVCFSGGRSSDDYYWDEGVDNRRICPSDSDREGWFAEPGIDNKASAYIDKFYATRVSNSEHH